MIGSSSKRNALVALILLIAVCVAVWFMQWQISSQSKLLEAQVSTLNEQGKQVASLLRLQRIAEATELDRTQLQSYFLARESNSIDFLTEVESIAPQLGVTLETKNLGSLGAGTADSVQWVEAEFIITGGRSQVSDFIQVLENVPYVSEITSISLASPNGVTWEANVVIQIRVLDYDQ